MVSSEFFMEKADAIFLKNVCKFDGKTRGIFQFFRSESWLEDKEAMEFCKKFRRIPTRILMEKQMTSFISL